ncbi:MAG: hypothetical protein Q9178_000571 [Gyalolechia marmorata]
MPASNYEEVIDIYLSDMPATHYEDVLDLIDYARDSMAGEHVTFDRIRDFLKPLPHAIEDESSRRIRVLTNLEAITKAQYIFSTAEAAIAEMEKRSARYRRNMRHFYELAVPKAYEAFITGSDAYDDVVASSLCELHDFVAATKVTAIGDKKSVLSDLKRDWRMLGGPEAKMWEPLYEIVTGRELLNE